MHVSGIYKDYQRVNIGEEKANIETEKVNIQDEKANIDVLQMYNEEIKGFTLKTVEHIQTIFDEFGTERVLLHQMDGLYHWVNALSEGTPITDSHGHDTVDYNSQKHRFICLDDGVEIEVRRWDNFGYSAGEYLIFEYDGTMHVLKRDDLYHPILSVKGLVRQMVEGYRALENGIAYVEGLMVIRDMETGTIAMYDAEGGQRGIIDT